MFFRKSRTFPMEKCIFFFFLINRFKFQYRSLLRKLQKIDSFWNIYFRLNSAINVDLAINEK